ncbi:nitrite reductase/ring-hydroxylating ferredoxin subunit [Pseudonocardia eucalypti]|nr:nitrite reductase/ring-hydroxylating ferredoxin subunit [Pseudonocardia eucalypti]
MRLTEKPIRRIERAVRLDGVAGSARDLVHRLLRRRRLKDALHGVWLGHPLHPALAQLALGSLLSASLIDLCGGRRRDSSRLIVVGLLATGPTAAAGWADFADGHEEQQRVGLVHAALNATAVGCYVGALGARARRSGRGRGRSVAGGVLAGTAAALGGHLSFRMASGANHAEEVQHIGPENWQPVGPVAELPLDQPVRRLIGEVPAFVLRRSVRDEGGETMVVLSDRCPHLSAPLHEGELSSVDCQPQVTCPWHGSVFRVSDGEVVHGPATAPVPRFDTRVRNGLLEAKVRTLPGVSAS